MTQDTALSILKTGANVFLTGEPGAGKTYTINQYIHWLETAGLNVAVTASTGIAATHIGGLTIHSWSGVGTRDTLTRGDLDLIATNERVVKRVKKTHVLIIDEISMLDGKLLDMVDVICRTIRMSTEAFGGMQVVCVGDFFQLPPIARPGEMMRYAFESRAWENLHPLVCYLTDQFRQEDEQLLNLLNSIRRGEIEEEHFTLLKEQIDIAYEDIDPTRLYTHNADVDTVNLQKLSELSGSSNNFKMSGKGNKILQESLMRNCLSPVNLNLKVEAMVMCTKNNFEAGYVNGTLARVVDFEPFEGYPIIETATKKRITIEPVSWEIAEEGKVIAAIEQVPLRLAWAITVHKSQGMSLDAVEVDLSKAFVYGQGYVALSRVRTLAGLKVLGMNPQALMVDPKIIKENERFKQESEAAEETFANMEEKEISAMHERFVKANGGKLPSQEELKSHNKGEVDRVKKESTQSETKRLLQAGKDLERIAEERKLTIATIAGHVEDLIDSQDLKIEELENLLMQDKNYQKTKSELFSIFQKIGTEKLKPIYEGNDGKYDYITIRLFRLLYTNKNI
ncbi:MAG: ATP-dependent RecD-like DNA helicase [Parcubacteria bacterium OLB19]|nr:MAG: ATP-dependent RecD-like DNA helicase [Parcubacteria bacterium OLB19]